MTYDKAQQELREIGIALTFDAEEKRNSFLLSTDAKSWAKQVSQ